jgi:DNA (cytosine-5)-methyltransferase 1
MLKTVDLFAGCGGMSLGFQNADFEILAAFDNWAKALAVYQKNFSHPTHLCDLQDSQVWQHIQDYTPQLLIGGPPCQDFSSAGKRDESLGRADLTIIFANIVTLVRPQFFVMENVDRITKTTTLSQTKQLLEQAGYGLSESILKASLCGVPQDRKRYFLVGELGGKEGGISPYLQANLAEKEMTVHDYLGDTLGIEYYYRHPRNYSRRGIYSIHEPSPTIRGVNRPIPQGYLGHSADPITRFDALRPLTTKERSLIQTFPEQFCFEGTKSDVEQMLGNAVPVKLAEFVANALKQYILKKPLSQKIPLQLSLL